MRQPVPLSSPVTLLVVKDNIDLHFFQLGSDEICECQVFGILQDLFRDEAAVQSVIRGRQINKDCCCNQSFLEPVFNVLCEIQKLTCCGFARSESSLLRDVDWFSDWGKPVEDQVLKQLVQVA